MFTETFSELDVPLFCLGMNGRRGWGRVLTRLNKLLKTYPVDLIHTQLFWADLLGRIVGKWNGIPVITTIQSSVYEPGIDFFHSPKRRWLDYVSGNFCNAKFIAVSDFVKRSATKRLGFSEEDIVVIYNTVDFDEFSPPSDEERRLSRQKLGILEKNPLLITVGKLNPPKGIGYLVKALPRVVEKYPETVLFVVGKGPMQSELEELVLSLGLKKNVRFLGQRDDVQDLLSASDLFILPTLSEGFSISLLEAVAMGLPCVTSDIGPIRELFGSTGSFLVQPGNSEALSKVILVCLETLDQMKQLALERRIAIREKFDVRKNVIQLGRLYETVLKDRGKRPR